jgi:hypothetical protein
MCAMLCHLCQNLIFSPAEELNLPNVDFLEDKFFVSNLEKTLTNVHQ